ncbi:MAG: hypothetical protein A2X84_05795 [Desulfuromonadaceae bacterium GWC2_58_13]|nr:MAG: hypothetical protein A2X84_05795 [Desulfuromonadaceae bacterium GWC2_58_13]
MKALLIKDEVLWNEESSSKLGTALDIKDSSNNLLIFSDALSEADILKVIDKTPRESYQLLDLEEAAEEDCDFMADSGLCYRKLQ